MVKEEFAKDQHAKQRDVIRSCIKNLQILEKEQEPDKIKFNDKYELEDNWTLYLHTQSHSDNYSMSYMKTCSFDTCEGWARFINNLPDAGTLLSKNQEVWMEDERIVAYSLFKNNIKPEWEEEMNYNGCEWGCREELDLKSATDMWVTLTASMACGELDALGVRVVNKNIPHRNLSKIEVWLSQKHDPAEVYSSIQQILCSINIDKIPNFHLLYHDSKKKEATDILLKKKKKFYKKL